MEFQNTLEFAKQLDVQDTLQQFRSLFYIPIMNGKEVIYLNGNSLGLQPKATQEYVLDELEDWASFASGGHAHARKPWMTYNELFPKQLSKLVGAHENEVVAMNSLTVNLHLLMVSFYRPTKERYKIICEAKAFSSDQYAMESQVRHYGFSPDDTIIEVAPRDGEHTIRIEDIIATIQKHGDSIALVLFSGVNYFSGQFFDIATITYTAHSVGAFAGFDLAHAVGNVPLALHDWDVDFACWCSYKYLNSGPGGVGGAFIHERHATVSSFNRFAGWWGNDKATRFQLQKGFKAIPSADGWQLSNAPILSMAAHKASLDIFDKAGIENLHQKRKLLTAYLDYLLNKIIDENDEEVFEIITPINENERGCQLSLLMLKDGKRIYDAITNQGVMSDWREPNVIRVAPVPLYNTFEDVFRFGSILKTSIMS
ncbi:MAG: kynureninase [Bacteroidetes bacterium]|nr:kynureninase [Bacteroidota bacterium]